MKTGYKISASSALLTVLFFFLPWVSISCNGQKVRSLTGWELANGTSLGPQEKLKGDYWLFLVLLGAICVLALAYLAFKRKHLIPADSIGLIVLGAVSILTLLWRYTAANNNKDYQGVVITPEFASWATVISNICIMVGGYLNRQHGQAIDNADKQSP